jgi:hypothetical protein
MNRVAFSEFVINPSSTKGNIFELWMISTQDSRYVLAMLSMSPSGNTISLAVNSSAASVNNAAACSFVSSVSYRLEMEIYVDSSAIYNANVALKSIGSSVCNLTLPLSNFNAQEFFNVDFMFALSQSSAGTSVMSRSVRTANSTDFLSIAITGFGIACQTASCSSASSGGTSTSSGGASTASVTSDGFSATGIIVGVTVGAVVVVVSISMIIIGVAVVLRRKRKSQVHIYQQETLQETQQAPEPDQTVRYNAFISAPVSF